MKNWLNTIVVGAVLIFVVSSTGCKRCYQCAVRDTNGDVQWIYKEVCASKKDYEAYKDICEEEALAEDETYTCDCAENLEID